MTKLKPGTLKSLVAPIVIAVLLLATPLPVSAVDGKLFIFTSYGARQSITAEGGGAGPISASNTNRGSFEQFDIVVLRGALRGGARIQIRCNNSQFVSAEGGGGGAVNCNRNVASTWETFTIFRAMDIGSARNIQPGDYVRIRANNGMFLKTQHADGTGAIVATGNSRDKEGMFTISMVDGRLPELLTQILRKSDFPGSAFTTNPESPMLGCTLTEEDADAVFHEPTPSGIAIGIWTRLSCQHSPALTVDPEFFRGVTLRNGWHIMEFVTPDTSRSGCSSSARTSPVVGSNNPYVQLRMHCGAFKEIAENVVSVTVAGPRGWLMQ